MPFDIDDDEKMRAVITVRISANENASFRKFCEQQNAKPSSMIRRLIRTASGLPSIVDPNALDEIRRTNEELRRIGVNLNQAVRAMHEGRATFEKDLAESLALVAEMVAGLQETHANLLRDGRRFIRAGLDADA